MPTLHTIGHSSHSIDAFLALLRLHAIDAVADVRSQPYSRRHPQFRREALRDALTRAGIEYCFLGRELGARSEDPECFVSGRVDFPRLAQTPAFRAGLDIVTERAARQRVALMCAERDPLTCHRTILVCRALALRPATGPERGSAAWSVQHILADGWIERQDEADTRLLAAVGIAPDLLRDRDEAIADAYRAQAERIAWTKPGA